MIDPEDLFFVEDLVQPCVQRHCTGQVRAKRFLHDDAGFVDELCLSQHPHRRQGSAGWNAQIVQPAALTLEGSLGLLDGRFQGGCASRQRHVVQAAGKGIPVRVRHLARREFIERLPHDFSKALCVEIVEGYADDPAARDEPGACQVAQSRQELAPRQIPRGAHQNHDLGIPRTYSWGNLCHRPLPLDLLVLHVASQDSGPVVPIPCRRSRPDKGHRRLTALL